MVESTANLVAAEHFEVRPVAGAAADLTQFGQRYWSLLGIDEYQEAVWSEQLSAFSQDSGLSHRRAYLLAAAGTRAVLSQHACARCDGPLSLRAREDFERHLAGTIPETCIDCDPLFMTAVGRESTPAAAHRRAQDRARAQHRLDIDAARETWAREQAAHVATHHDGSGPTTPPPGPAPVAAQLTALTLLTSDPDATTIAPITALPIPLAPTPTMAETLLTACRDHDLLRTHPQSPVEACRWERTFDDALTAADGNPAAVGEPRCTGTELIGARWYQPDPPPGTEPQHRTVLAWLESLTPDRLTLQQVGELSDLCNMLMVEETLRQLNAGLNVLRLAPVPAQHHLRLRQTVMDMTEFLTLAQCSTLVGRAVRGAAKVKDANPRFSASAVTTHAVNRLVGDWERIWERGDPSDLVPATAPSGSFCPDLSALTRFAFALYGMNPWEAQLTTVWALQDTAAWPQIPVAPAAEIIDPTSGTDAQAALDALYELDDVERVEDWALLTAAGHVQGVVKRMLELTGDLRTSLAAGFVAAERLTTPIAVPGSPGRFRFAGWYIIEVMMGAARATASTDGAPDSRSGPA